MQPETTKALWFIGIIAGILSLFRLSSAKATNAPGKPSGLGFGGESLKKLVALVAQFEGFRANSYGDVGGIQTIGYGSTIIDGKKVNPGQTITENEAKKLLENRLSKLVEQIKGILKTDLSATRVYLLACLADNIGFGALKTSGVIKKINAKDTVENIGISWLAWNKARINGVLTPVKGLTNRREIEFSKYKNNII